MCTRVQQLKAPVISNCNRADTVEWRAVDHKGRPRQFDFNEVWCWSMVMIITMTLIIDHDIDYDHDHDHDYDHDHDDDCKNGIDDDDVDDYEQMVHRWGSS